MRAGWGRGRSRRRWTDRGGLTGLTGRGRGEGALRHSTLTFDHPRRRQRRAARRYVDREEQEAEHQPCSEAHDRRKRLPGVRAEGGVDARLEGDKDPRRCREREAETVDQRRGRSRRCHFVR